MALSVDGGWEAKGTEPIAVEGGLVVQGTDGVWSEAEGAQPTAVEGVGLWAN